MERNWIKQNFTQSRGVSSRYYLVFWFFSGVWQPISRERHLLNSAQYCSETILAPPCVTHLNTLCALCVIFWGPIFLRWTKTRSSLISWMAAPVFASAGCFLCRWCCWSKITTHDVSIEHSSLLFIVSSEFPMGIEMAICNVIFHIKLAAGGDSQHIDH